MTLAEQKNVQLRRPSARLIFENGSLNQDNLAQTVSLQFVDPGLFLSPNMTV